MSEEIAIYGGAFNPPGLHHRVIAEAVGKVCETVTVPSGPREDKLITNDIEPMHRAAMCDMNFCGLGNVRNDNFDLESKRFLRQLELQEKFGAGGRKVWHVVGADLVRGGATGKSEIQSKWFRGEHLWTHLHFIVVLRDGYPLESGDLPPNSRLVMFDGRGVSGASKDIRKSVFNRLPYSDLVLPRVADYIERYNLYRGGAPRTMSILELPDPKAFIVADDNNSLAVLLAKKYSEVSAPLDDAQCILAIGGDGFMLHAVRKLWPHRLPFIGVNAGHEGFLLNDDHLFNGNIRELLTRTHLYLQSQLAVEVEDAKGEVSHYTAFNDAWVDKSGQASWLSVSFDGAVRKLIGDGVLVATPAGSTGYAWPMGADPLPVNVKGLLVVGKCVKKPRGWKAITMPETSVIEIVSEGGAKRTVNGFIDGRPIGEVTRMKIRYSQLTTVELGFSPKRDLTAKLLEQTLPPEI